MLDLVTHFRQHVVFDESTRHPQGSREAPTLHPSHNIDFVMTPGIVAASRFLEPHSR